MARNKKIMLQLILVLFTVILVTVNMACATQDYNSTVEEKNVKSNTIEITEDNYDQYFNSYDELETDELGEDTTLNIHSLKPGTDEIYITDNDNTLKSLTITTQNTQINNTAMIICVDVEKLVLSNISLDYSTQHESTSFLSISMPENTTTILENITITCTQDNTNTQGQIHPLEIRADNVVADNLYIDAQLPSNTITYTGRDDKPHSIALYTEGENITVNNSTINLRENTKQSPYQYYNTLYAVYNSADYYTLNNTRINVEGDQYVYAVVTRSSNNRITYNNVTAVSQAYAAGINVEGSQIKNNLVSYNNIHTSAGNRTQDATPTGAEDSAYPLILLDYSYKGSDYQPLPQSINNTTYTHNNITGSAGNIYAIEVYGGTNTQLTHNMINITGRTPMGIGVIGENISVTHNNITSIGQTNNTEKSADYLKPRTTGIYTYLTSKGITITHNTVNTSNGRSIMVERTNNTNITLNTLTTTQHDYCIEVNGTNNTIQQNYVKSRTDTPIKATRNNTVRDNTDTPLEQITRITLNQTTGLVNKPTTITAYITDILDNPISDGIITITDEEDNTLIQQRPENGTVAVEVTYNQETELLITATYTPTTHPRQSTTTINILTIKQAYTTTVSIEATTITGQTQITVHIEDYDQTNNTGQIYYKINGKILRDATTGKILYTQITDNTTTLEIPTPKTWNEDTTIQAIYIKKYNTPIESQTINPTITTQQKLNINNIATTTGSEVTITVTTKNLDNGKVVLKVNGKTVKADDGKLYAKVIGNTVTFVYTIPKTLKAGDYTIKAVYTSGATKLEAESKLVLC